MFEKKTETLLPTADYLARLGRSACAAMVVVALSLLMGSAGYHYVADLDWVDALLNASMILTGMGPVDPMVTTEAKLFASFYALYSGVAFLSITAVMLAPVIHRLLHKFHIEEESDAS